MQNYQLVSDIMPKKVWWKSSSIWGIIVTFLMAVATYALNKAGIDPSVVPPAPANPDYESLKQAYEALRQTTQPGNDLSGLAPLIIGLASTIYGIYHRATNVTQLTSTIEKAKIENAKAASIQNTVAESLEQK